MRASRSDNGTWQVEWDDARSFLSNLRVLKKTIDVRWVGAPGNSLLTINYWPILRAHHMVMSWYGMVWCNGYDVLIGVSVPVDEQADLEQLLEEHDCVPVFLQPELQVTIIAFASLLAIAAIATIAGWHIIWL